MFGAGGKIGLLTKNQMTGKFYPEFERKHHPVY